MTDTMKKTITQRLHAALKDHAAERVAVLRMLLAAIKNKEITLQKELSDADTVGVIAAQIKLRREAVDSYAKGGRQDRAEQEQREIAVLEEFMPPPMTEQEISGLIDTAIQKTGAASAKDMGKVMGFLMPMVKGRADGKLIQQLVRDRLSALS